MQSIQNPNIIIVRPNQTSAVNVYHGAKGEKGDQGIQGVSGEGVIDGGTTGQVLAKKTNNDYDTEWITNVTAPVSSVNTQTGAVVLDADDISDSLTTKKFTNATDISRLANTSGTNTGDQDLSGLLPNSHLTDFAHADIAHTNRTALNAVSGTNTGDETNSTIITKIGFTPENSANKGQNNGYASLDSGGKIPSAQLPSTILVYKGTWNASTNTPTLATPTLLNAGFVYIVSVAGNRFTIDWNVGDWLIFNDSGVIEKSDNTDSVVSVNSQTGVVVLDADDISDSATSKKFTNASDISRLANTSGTNTGDQNLSGLLPTSHLTDFVHSDIAHSNRTALDNVTGTNTGDQDLSGLLPKVLAPIIKTTTDNILSTERNVIGNHATVAIVLTLPASPATGEEHSIANKNDAIVTVNFNGKTFYSDSTFELEKGESIRIIYDGTNWS